MGWRSVGPIEIGGQGRNSEGSSMGGAEVLLVAIEETSVNFIWVCNCCPMFGEFRWLIVTWNIDVSDKGMHGWFDEMSNFGVDMF